MTKKTKKIPIEQGTCPECGCTNLDYDASDLDGELVGYPWKCPDCNATGVEWYRLEFSSHAVRKYGKELWFKHYDV